uniref:uS13 n=1 Tax=Paranosema locustae TaxID=235221 RepID=UPI00187D6E47|nr:Chain SS0, uS13 [Paranosema locustae]|eukprot:jgi/Antlo1/1465/2560
MEGRKSLFETFTSEPAQIQHIIRMLNTNIDGSRRVVHALTQIKGIGKRMSDAIVKRTGVDASKRMGALSASELELLQDGIQNPAKYGIPRWMFNHQFDAVDGTDSHLIGNQIDANLRFYIEKGKKMKHIRVCRLARGLKVRGQRTKSNGRGGKTIGVSRKK